MAGKPDTGEPGRVRQTAPDTKAVSKGVWGMIESNPGFNARMRAVELRLKSGGGVLYEVRDGALRKVRRGGRSTP